MKKSPKWRQLLSHGTFRISLNSQMVFSREQWKRNPLIATPTAAKATSHRAMTRVCDMATHSRPFQPSGQTIPFSQTGSRICHTLWKFPLVSHTAATTVTRTLQFSKIPTRMESLLLMKPSSSASWSATNTSQTWYSTQDTCSRTWCRLWRSRTQILTIMKTWESTRVTFWFASSGERGSLAISRTSKATQTCPTLTLRRWLWW